MLSAKLLIDDVLETVQDPSFSRDSVLRYLNSGNLAVADKLLLPDLADGSGSVTTVVGENSVALPSDYHKNIFQISVLSEPVQFFQSLQLMINSIGLLGVEAGNVEATAVLNKKLYYYKVPATAVDVDILYYRVPTAMTDETTSYPDGVSNSDDFEECLLSYACWKIFKKIEDGIEGQAVNTANHENKYLESLGALSSYCSKETGPSAAMPLAPDHSPFLI